VAAQPCLLCGKRPVDPHHIRFAQKQSLGRKVSEEFTVPLRRSHHRALHRSGSEYLWWENVGIDPLKAARKLWKKTRLAPVSKVVARRQQAGSVGADIAEHACSPIPAAAHPISSDVAAREQHGEGIRS
jgi:hypothetical protein